MKTFEEFRFKVKHSSIASIWTKFSELKSGDWFYIIDEDYVRHCQITEIGDSEPYIELYWINCGMKKCTFINYKDIDKDTVVFTHRTYSTNDDLANESVKECHNKEIIEHPAK